MIPKDVENFINQTSFEDLISIKLDLAFRQLKGRYYGFPILKNLYLIVEDALYSFLRKNGFSEEEKALILGTKEKDK